MDCFWIKGKVTIKLHVRQVIKLKITCLSDIIKKENSKLKVR